MKPTLPAFAVFLFFAIQSCTADELPAPESCQGVPASYEENIRKIIDESCAYSGCHDGAGGVGPGNFTSYETLSPWLDENFRQLVIDLRDDPLRGMPPSKSAYPQTIKEDLTDAEIELMRCWIQSGFPRD